MQKIFKNTENIDKRIKLVFDLDGTIVFDGISIEKSIKAILTELN